jgi:hypothetical protein
VRPAPSTRLLSVLSRDEVRQIIDQPDTLAGFIAFPPLKVAGTITSDSRAPRPGIGASAICPEIRGWVEDAIPRIGVTSSRELLSLAWRRRSCATTSRTWRCTSRCRLARRIRRSAPSCFVSRSVGRERGDSVARRQSKRGERLPVVRSIPETMTLLGAMPGTPRLMAAFICGVRIMPARGRRHPAR